MVGLFRKKLLAWHRDIDRKLPWKDTNDPYKIWISEIILQQTRVAYGINYYHRLISLFPTVQDLAQATQDKVLSAWKGLGYYARARNLHSAAKQIVHDYDGHFPCTYEEIIKLKGVGPYTASAIASFAYGQPHAVLDGNAFRVLARYFNESTPIDTTEGKHLFAALSEECLSKKKPADYNQAIMDFGALMCTPSVPSCHICPLQKSCQGYHAGTVDLLPIKSKKIEVKKRFFHFFIFKKVGSILLQKRQAKDIWMGLYQLPAYESATQLTKKELLAQLSEETGWYHSDLEIKRVGQEQQRLTHRLILGTFYEVQSAEMYPPGDWVDMRSLEAVAMPKLINDILMRSMREPELPFV